MADDLPLLSRRGVLGAGLASFAIVALVREARAFEGPHPISVRRWVEDQQEIALALAAGRAARKQVDGSLRVPITSFDESSRRHTARV